MNLTHHKTKAMHLLALTVIFAGLNGCSSTPGVDEIKQALGSGMANCPQEYMMATNIKKTNGIPNGSTYTVAYSYDLTVIKDFPDLTTNSVESYRWSPCYMSLVRSGVLVAGPEGLESFSKKGQTAQLTGEMAMVKSERGWVRAN